MAIEFKRDVLGDICQGGGGGRQAPGVGGTAIDDRLESTDHGRIGSVGGLVV